MFKILVMHIKTYVRNKDSRIGRAPTQFTSLSKYLWFAMLRVHKIVYLQETKDGELVKYEWINFHVIIQCAHLLASINLVRVR